MTKVKSLDTFQWYTTPQELRRIADKMERKWKEMSVGDHKLVENKHGDGGRAKLSILIDQERIS